MCGAAAKFGNQVVFAHLTSVENFGRYAYASALVQLLAVPATAGFNLAVVQYLPGLVARREWRHVRSLNRRATLTTLALSVAAAIALITIAEVFASSSNKTPVVVAAVFLPSISIVALRREVLRSIGHVWTAYLLADVVTPCLAIVAGVGILSRLESAPSAEGLLLVTGLSFSVVALAQGSRIRGMVRHEPRRPGPDPDPDTASWVRGLRVLFAITVITTAFSQIDIIAVGLSGSAENAAHYAAANKLSGVASVFLIAVASVFAPRMAERWSGADSKSIAELHRQATRMSFWPTAIIAVPVLIAPDIPLGLFGPTFSDAATPLRILILAQVVSAATGPVGYLMIVTGAQNLVLKVFALAAVVDLTAQVLFTPIYGPTGAAIASFGAMLTWNVPLMVVARRRFQARIFGAI